MIERDDGWIPTEDPIIVCAACVNPDTGAIVAGPRHFDRTMWRQVELSAESGLGALPFIGKRIAHKRKVRWGIGEEGFIDQFGRFFDREEAWIIAERNDQIRNKPTIIGTLFSEDLY